MGRYEQLRAVALAGEAGGHALGLGLVITRGLPAWMTACNTVPAPPPPPAATLATSSPAAVSQAVVAVLAAMTVGLLQATQAKGAS